LLNALALFALPIEAIFALVLKCMKNIHRHYLHALYI
jgi:hypothetical protein